ILPFRDIDEKRVFGIGSKVRVETTYPAKALARIVVIIVGRRKIIRAFQSGLREADTIEATSVWQLSFSPLEFPRGVPSAQGAVSRSIQWRGIPHRGAA
ncbi:MAG TPA: hypothetical protein PK093_03590, partial [Phycisphaerae bacterium]|nr:hypothetical protein [Phycisphaerae bacterium]